MQPASTWMMTPPLQVSPSEDFVLKFKHRYRFEFGSSNGQVYYYDGGQLMITTDDGATWRRLDGAGYTGKLFAGADNPRGNEQAYVGESAQWPVFQPQTLNLGTAYAGKTVRIGWVMHTDAAVTATGWEVDDIQFAGLLSTPFPKILDDAQQCAGLQLAVQSGAGQSATVGAAFTAPLQVRVTDGMGQPQAGVMVAFDAPTGAGASVLFDGGLAQVSVTTDANGAAQSPALTANAEAGSYEVTANVGIQTVRFALTNLGSSSGGNGNGTTPGVRSFSGASPQGQGLVTGSVASSQTALPDSAGFTHGAIVAASTLPALEGYDLPFGLAEFVLQNTGVGNTVRFRIQYPSAVPAGAEYWKWGATKLAGTPQWYRIPMQVVASDTVEISLTDGGEGDSDNRADGVITDPGGLAVPRSAVAPVAAAVPVPGLTTAGVLALVLLMGAAGAAGRLRRKG